MVLCLKQVVDSVQAGLRATGELSLVDWPRFADCEPPDFEVFSKALNGGQFPLSVVAFSERARDAYKTVRLFFSFVDPQLTHFRVGNSNDSRRVLFTGNLRQHDDV